MLQKTQRTIKRSEWRLKALSAMGFSPSSCACSWYVMFWGLPDGIQISLTFLRPWDQCMTAHKGAKKLAKPLATISAQVVASLLPRFTAVQRVRLCLSPSKKQFFIDS
jgi:hypothetical protein